MDAKNMEPRFSLNGTHLPSPIAESTCLNINGTCSSSSFRWGGSPMTLKSRSNSSISLNNTQSGSVNEIINTSLSQRSKVNISKIDPRMYADVQSKGLASRIVKYHENGTRLNRSMSMTNLYHKPGQFPIVHLKKTELPSRAITQNISMTRIAPPEKSVFHGNTVSSLLRSNSIIGFQKSDEEISCENRPIMHPPPTENDLAPTRSVLEVLKEISRKRINNDDLSRNDSIKKYCNRDSADIVDLPNLNSEKNNTTVNGKRQREQFSSQQHLNKKHQTLNSNQRSPEQIAKKRFYSYNNDIKSSLSSSLIHVNKRKYNEQKNGLNSNDFNRRSPSESYEKQQSKVHRTHTEFRFQELSKTLSCNDPITPIPPTPLNQNIDSSNLTKLVVSVPALRTISEPVFYSNNIIASASPNKKKLTLFNKNYEETDIKEGIKKTNDSQSLDAEFESIQFVKPRKCSSSLGIKNPLIERTQKSKLALMLCGLRGELYQGNEDEIDAVQNQVNDKSQSTPIPIKSEDETNLATNNIYNKATNITKNTNTVENTIHKPLVETNNSTSTNVSKETPLSATSIITTTTTAKTLTIPTTSSSPFAGGFKFPQSSSIGNSAFSNSIEKQSPLSGIKLTPQSQSMTTPVTSNSAPTFTANTSTTTNATSIIINTTAPLATLNVPVTSTTSTSTVTSTSSNPGGFTFKNNLQNTTVNFETTPVDKSVGCAVSNSLASNSSTSAFEKNTYSSSFTAVQSSITSTVPISSAPILPFGNSSNTTGPIGDTAKPFGFSSSAGFTLPTTVTTVASITPTFGSVTSSFGSIASNDIKKNNSKLDISTSASLSTKSAFKAPSPAIPSIPSAGTSNMHLTNTPTSNTFSFGTVANKPSATATPFPKVQNEQFNIAVGSSFVNGNTTNSNTDATATSTSTTVSSTTFSFVAANTINTNAGNSNVNSTFKFGSQSTNPIFGNPLSSNSLNENNKSTTGSNVAESATQSQSNSIFGAVAAGPTTSKPFAFGSNTNTFGGGSTLISTTPAQTKNIFGTSAPTSNASVNVVKPSFNFGANTPPKTAESKSLFGGTNSNSNAGSTNTFGTIATSPNTFAFGANNTATSNNLFCTGNNQNQNQSNGFSFGSNSATVQSKPTAVTGPSAFSFGNSNTLGNNSTSTQPPTNTVTPFSFGNAGNGNISNKSDTATSTFAFGSNNTINNTGTTNNLFSSQNANATSASTNATFNFSSSGTGTGTGVTSAASPANNNIFAAPNMANPNERRIRRATRRLQK